MSNLESLTKEPGTTPACGMPSWETIRAHRRRRTRRLWGVALAPLVGYALLPFLFVGFTAWQLASLWVGSMHVYATALEYVEHHPVIAAELGAPVEARWFPSRGRVSSASGRAEFEIELTGARNDGIATVHSRRRAGTWAVEQAFLKVGGVERTLLAQAAPLGAHDEGGVR